MKKIGMLNPPTLPYYPLCKVVTTIQNNDNHDRNNNNKVGNKG